MSRYASKSRLAIGSGKGGMVPSKITEAKSRARRHDILEPEWDEGRRSALLRAGRAGSHQGGGDSKREKRAECIAAGGFGHGTSDLVLHPGNVAAQGNRAVLPDGG